MKGFTIYQHGGHLYHVTWTKYINFLPPFAWRLDMNLVDISLVISEERSFENDDIKMTTDLLPRSPNDLDL